ncbi:serine/threonine/tyrosine-interacting protein [Leptinotarsa decemlineata]|uniref:serine/threonine/tyrosine-interacting protein n=1 Tax=Leptinotarsa decemlineata TaxID=7539 RepID=UPI000C254077|nr:serine/threonine/tyrosine-interacting protein-like [Leptinotarsa decemlineata]XP_023022260.1 serine/threonine/tyrosine-interacting protein-like [Leptinotarsa decemlineata]
MIDITPGNFLQGEKNVGSDTNPSFNSRSPYPSHKSHHIYFHGTMQEIIPGVYLGPFTSAYRNCLLENGINYVVCVRQQFEAHFIKPQVADPAFAYLTLDIADNVTENIIRFFPKVRQFIDEALSNNCKVLVHGNAGNSRSATLVLAYIMEKYGLTCGEALHYVKEKRASVDPNEGFRAQLIEYEPIYKARQTMATGGSSTDNRQKRKCEQLTETVDYNLIQRPPSPDMENNNDINVYSCKEFSDHLFRLLKRS